MKVTGVNVHTVSVPFTEPETWRYGRLWGLTSAIVEVETDEGVTGVGETNGSPTIALVGEAIRETASWLVGQDPLEINRFGLDARDRGWHHYPAIGNMALGAIETALWDIAGKVCGVPVHQLFGGRLMDRVPYYWYVTVPDRTPETAGRQAAEGAALGFNTMYMKIGFEVESDIGLVRAIRDAVGDGIAIRVDVNEGWSVFEARRALAALAELDVEFVEEPTSMHDREGLAFLRRSSAVRLGSNQSSWFAHNALEVIERRAADVIVTDPHQLGGLGPFRDVASMCGIAGIPVVKHAFGDLGPTTVATMHVLATLPPPALAHQQFITILEHDLLAEPLRFVDGALEVPVTPGLGIELDHEAVAHYERLFREYGEFSGYGSAERPSPVPDHELGRLRRGARAAVSGN